ncbi:hypothetical protein HWV62_37841 [Athelia sp. TMB]|nr:hypothetical protein HWV62_37841 [Athelia sp. TMB]
MSRIHETHPFSAAPTGGAAFDMPPIMPGWPSLQAGSNFDPAVNTMPYPYPAPSPFGYYAPQQLQHGYIGGRTGVFPAPPLAAAFQPAPTAPSSDFVDGVIWAAQGATPGFHPGGEGYPRMGEIDSTILDATIRENQELKQTNQRLVMELEESRQRNTTQARGRSSSPRRQTTDGVPPRQRSPYQVKGDRRRSSSPNRRPLYHRPSPSRSLSRTPPGYATPRSRSSSITRGTHLDDIDHPERTLESRISSTIANIEAATSPTMQQITLLTRVTPRNTIRDNRDTHRDTHRDSDGRVFNRSRHIGLNKPRNLSNRFLHGRWAEFVVSTLRDCDTLYDAAEYDGKALLYLDYCNAIYQRPEATKTEGMRALIARWNAFIRIHRARRDELRGLHAVPVKTVPTRARRRPNRSHSPTTSDTTTQDLSAPLELAALHIADIVDRVDDLPPQYDVLMATASIVQQPATDVSSSDSPSCPTALTEDTIIGPSLADCPWALTSPEHWPSGVRAIINGLPTPVTENLYGTNHAPYEGDVKGWGWLEGLAPAHDGLDDSRYDQFMRVAINNLSIPIHLNTALDGLQSFTDMPIEHYPFDTTTLKPAIIAQWLYEHGVSRSSEDMVAIHGYASQVVSRYPTVALAPYIPPPTPDERLDYGEESE